MRRRTASHGTVLLQAAVLAACYANHDEPAPDDAGVVDVAADRVAVVPVCGDGTCAEPEDQFGCAADCGAVAVSTGESHTCVVLVDGTARCWGGNYNGQLGDGTTTNSAVPVTVTGLTGAVDVTVEPTYSCALLADGSVRCWGSNARGGLGNPGYGDSSIPVPVRRLSDAVALGSGAGETCAVRAGGSVACWGMRSLIPVEEPDVAGAVAVSPPCALVEGGSVACWSYTEPAVLALRDIVELAHGFDQVSCAVFADGTAGCWGSMNLLGELGDGTFAPSAVPAVVSGLSDAVTVGVGTRHACAATADGALWCWGSRGRSCPGIGDRGSCTSFPTQVPSLSGVIAVDGGGYVDSSCGGADRDPCCGETRTCAVLADGTAWCWGDNGGGTLGDGTTTDSPAPVAVAAW